MAEVVATWVDGVRFVATGTGGHSIVTDVPDSKTGQARGFKPSELLLAGLAGCTGSDVVDILRKQRQEVTGLEIKVIGHQASDPPWAFEMVEIEYTFRGENLNETLIKRAIELSESKYCSVGATIAAKARIVNRFTVEG
ncbi:MAG: OsmC family protein [Bacteroidetes bacterium]|nr:OsmC family protein [Bacteroidota bacterium]MCL5027043.1 OsmC family protein [Chloroflexota bacterium]